MDSHSVNSIINNWCATDTEKTGGMTVSRISWNDCGRTKGSCFGKNIVDQTLSVKSSDGSWIDCPLVKSSTNFDDKTTDQSHESFSLVSGDDKQRISLKNYITSLDKSTLSSKLVNLWDIRDDKGILTQHHHTILPLPNDVESVEFTANCSSYTNGQTPSVLCIFATPTSSTTQLLTKSGQQLYINKNNKALTSKVSSAEDKKNSQSVDDAKTTGTDGDTNKVLIIQIPIITTNKMETLVRPRQIGGNGIYRGVTRGIGNRGQRVMEDADVEDGEEIGPFTGLDLLKSDAVTIIRDTSLPIRADIITFSVCGSQLTSENFIQIKQKVSQYDIFAKASGSLVSEGQTGRTTESGLNNSIHVDMHVGRLGF
jgi:hypothetical protein